MLSRGWWPGVLAVGAGLALAASAPAGDDTMDLKLKKSPSLVGGVGAAGEFSHDARATDDEDDTEDVNLRYRLGYRRGFYGGGYVFPRTFAWRAGYNDGLFGYPRYWGGSYGYGSFYRSYYYAAPVYATRTYFYSAPLVYDPCCCPISLTAGNVGSSATLGVPADSSGTLPMPQPKPSYRYDGGPSRPMTAPEPLPPLPNEPTPKGTKGSGAKSGAGEGRLVKGPAPKKHKFAAYGEHLRSTRDDETLYVKQKK